ncbi:MAG: FxLYD domain-containing protein [Actinomycetota bacterium]
MVGSAVRILAVVAAVAPAGCMGDAADLNPVERDAGEAGVHIEVVGCELDETTGNVTETVEVTSDREYTTILVAFRLVDAQGTIAANTSTSATDVRPGETYRLEMPLSPAGELGQGFTCEADLELATEPFG